MMASQPKIKCTEEKAQVKGSIRGKVILKMYLKILQYSPKKKTPVFDWRISRNFLE